MLLGTPVGFVKEFVMTVAPVAPVEPVQPVKNGHRPKGL